MESEQINAEQHEDELRKVYQSQHRLNLLDYSEQRWTARWPKNKC